MNRFKCHSRNGNEVTEKCKWEENEEENLTQNSGKKGREVWKGKVWKGEKKEEEKWNVEKWWKGWKVNEVVIGNNKTE